MRKETLDWFYTCHMKVSMPHICRLDLIQQLMSFSKNHSVKALAFIYMRTGIFSPKNFAKETLEMKYVFVKEDGKIGLNSLQCSHDCWPAALVMWTFAQLTKPAAEEKATRCSHPQGRVALPNRMNFRKNSKRPSTPHPHFLKIILQVFYDRYG